MYKYRLAAEGRVTYIQVTKIGSEGRGKGKKSDGEFFKNPKISRAVAAVSLSLGRSALPRVYLCMCVNPCYLALVAAW